MDRSALGDRMKRYEETTRYRLPRRAYTIMRLDGRAFHSYTVGLDRPFDYQLMADMDAVAVALCTEVAGTAVAYVQSDEITLVLVDFATPTTTAWFDGVVQKMVSVSASYATAHLNRLRYPERTTRIATFDARVFTLADQVEVANMLVWRQRDAIRNSVTMSARALFSERRLHGLSTTARRDLLASAGVDWDDYPEGARYGRVVTAVAGTVEVPGSTGTAVHLSRRWEARPAPVFDARPGGFLSETIPPLPSLNNTAG